MKTSTPLSKPKKTPNSATILKIHPSADFAIDYFENRRLLKKRPLQKALKELQEHGSKANQVQKLVGIKNRFLMQVGEEFVLIFSVQGRTVTVLDVFTREKLDTLQSL